MTRRVNIGCGPYKVADAINIDANPHWKPDIVRDVRNGLPFDSDSVQSVTASHFLEHLDWREMVFVLDECYRVLVPGGRMMVCVPIMEFISRDHLQVFSEDGLDCFVNPDAGPYFQKSFVWKLISKNIRRDGAGRNNLHVEWEAVK